MKLTIDVDAVQWKGEGYLCPDGVHLCVPEIHFSADRKQVYFTYADLRSLHWIDFDEHPMPQPEKFEFMCSGIVTKCKVDGQEIEYWRQVWPFSCWSIKSEASIKRDWKPVYLDRNDMPQLRAFLDYCDIEKWGTLENGRRALPPRAEYRVVDGGAGRGFRPIYLTPGSWLVKEAGREAYVLPDEKFQAMRSGLPAGGAETMTQGI